MKPQFKDMEHFTFTAACGDIERLVCFTRMNHGTIDIMVGNFCFGTAVNYYIIGWTVKCYADDYFKWDGARERGGYPGECVMQDDKDAILDRIREAGWF